MAVWFHGVAFLRDVHACESLWVGSSLTSTGIYAEGVSNSPKNGNSSLISTGKVIPSLVWGEGESGPPCACSCWLLQSSPDRGGLADS